MSAALGARGDCPSLCLQTGPTRADALPRRGPFVQTPLRKGQPVPQEFSERTVVGEFALGRTASVRVTLLERTDGSQLVDIRRFQSADWYTGPTKKGVAIGVDKLDELIDLLRRATEAS